METMNSKEIIEGLRKRCYWRANDHDACKPSHADAACYSCEAADLIESLEAKNIEAKCLLMQQARKISGLDARVKELEDWQTRAKTLFRSFVSPNLGRGGTWFETMVYQGDLNEAAALGWPEPPKEQGQ